MRLQLWILDFGFEVIWTLGKEISKVADIYYFKVVSINSVEYDHFNQTITLGVINQRENSVIYPYSETI